MSKDNIKGYETRHIAYCTDYEKQNDLLVVNEYVHREDGTREKSMRFIENYEREFYIVNKGERTFNDKLQWIDERKVEKFKSTQCQLYKKINNILFKHYHSNKDALSDPYVFGCAPTPQSELRHKYLEKWEHLVTPKSSVAVIDTETDVLHGTGEIVLITISFKDRIFCGIVRGFLSNTPDSIAEAKARAVCDEHIGDFLAERNANVEFGFFDNAGDATNACIQKAHEWQPDFVIFWNMDFDIPKMLEALAKYGYKDREVFSDPRVPRKYKFFSYRPGPETKILHDGRSMGLAPYERWHVANAPATFFLACAMNTYYRLRMAKGKIPGGYSLDATLARHLDLSKFEFKPTAHLTGLEKHVVMQRDYPYEYIVYNIFDCIGVELLDEKNKDFELKFNTRCTLADYTEFKSGPRITEVKMTYRAPLSNQIWGTVGGAIKDELDSMVVDANGWTMTLPSFIIEDSPVKVMQDWRGLNSLVYFHVSDLDITSTYPAVQVLTNASKPTTVREVVKVEGVSEENKRRMFVDMLTGVSSCVEVCNIGFGLPTLTELQSIYQRDKK